MLAWNPRENQQGSNFDAIQFELEREEIFNRSQNSYAEYEIDRDMKWNSRLYRVWCGRLLLGTFYLKNKKWIANPYYENHKYLGLGESVERQFRSNQLAINHIVRSYEGTIDEIKPAIPNVFVGCGYMQLLADSHNSKF